jgi:trans-aconitate methyltransferase
MHTNGDSKGLSSLSPEDFAYQFGVELPTLSEYVLRMIHVGDWGYRHICGRERDELITDILRVVDAGKMSQAGERKRWDKGWAENLDSFSRSGNLGSLVPRYIRGGRPIRLLLNFAQPEIDNFEWEWYRVFRHWLFETFLADVDAVYEFGCGTGHNLDALGEMYPDKTYLGLDWSPPAVELVNKISRAFSWSISGRRFDFFEPDASLHLPPNTAVLTIGALEQTGERYESFFRYLLDERPAICVHVEPIPEWYDDRDLVDYTALRMLKARGYWSGFPTFMAQLVQAGKAEILFKRRTYVGSLFVEGYMVFVWRPL